MSRSAPILRRFLLDGWRGQLGWSVGIAAVLSLYLPLFPALQSPDLTKLLASLPPELIRSLGYDQISTGTGYTQATFFGLGRLGLRTALNLMQVHRGGPKKITVIDGQKISADDVLFRIHGGTIGEFKTDFIKKLAGPDYSREIVTINQNISSTNLNQISGDVVCIEIAGGDTLPTTAQIVLHAHRYGAKTISTMGIFGIGDENITSVDIEKADPNNPIVEFLMSRNIRNHQLVGTGKLIRDWEPVTPYVLDRVSQAITAEILTFLHIKC